MITEAYFTNSKDARYANKHFGITCVQSNGAEFLPTKSSKLKRFYVHPDALEVLLPQKGDEIEINGEQMFYNDNETDSEIIINARNGIMFAQVQWR